MDIGQPLPVLKVVLFIVNKKIAMVRFIKACNIRAPEV